MFISQVIFEADSEHEEMMRGLMDSKRTSIEGAEKVISSEVWWRQDSKNVAFAVIGKWPAQEDFQEWLVAIHPNGHKKSPEGAPEIRKTINRFELVE